jgi:large repetitive protein
VQHPSAFATRDEPEVAVASLQAFVQPNPTAGGSSLTIQAIKAEKCRIALYDVLGRRLFVREIQLIEGTQDIPLPETAELPNGVYLWKVITNTLKVQGHLVKQ